MLNGSDQQLDTKGRNALRGEAETHLKGHFHSTFGNLSPPIQLRTFAYVQLVNKHYENEVTLLSMQNLS